MVRGGTGSQGARGGLGAIDSQLSPTAAFRALRARDQGGAAVDTTRLHWAGLHSFSGSNAPFGGMLSDAVPGGGTGQMLCVFVDYFPVAGRIVRLGTRTNGTIGADATARLKIGAWAWDGTLGLAGAFSGSAFPGRRIGQSSDLVVLPGANRRLISTVDIAVAAGSYVALGLVLNAAAASNKHTIVGYRRNCLFPVLGWTMDLTAPSTIAEDALTFGVGWRHAIAYTGTEDLPDPFPQTAPVALADGAAVDTLNIPGVAIAFVAG